VYVSWARFVSVFFYSHELLSIVFWRNVSDIGKRLCACAVTLVVTNE
jgi:hypothetical protein